MRRFIFLAILFCPHPLGSGLRKDALIVWNVGQGLWSTVIEGNSCFHFDAGGEKIPRTSIQLHCFDHENEMFFSHWDWDHISGVEIARGLFPRLCLAASPDGLAPSPRKAELFRGLARCPRRSAQIQEIRWPQKFSKRARKNTNAESRIWLWRSQILFPGDSPTSEEKVWARKLPQASKIHWLIAGHHGSRTSTSEFLLEKLRNLKTAVISAREKKYGHPHKEVIARLRSRKVQMLKTEDWGNLVMEL